MDTYPPTPGEEASKHLRFIGKMVCIVLGSWLAIVLIIAAIILFYGLISSPKLGPYGFRSSEAGSPHPSYVYFEGKPLRHSDGKIVTADVAARTTNGLALLNLQEARLSESTAWHARPAIMFATDGGSVQVFKSFRALEEHCRALGYGPLDWRLTWDVSPVANPQRSLPDVYK